MHDILRALGHRGPVVAGPEPELEPYRASMGSHLQKDTEEQAR